MSFNVVMSLSVIASILFTQYSRRYFKHAENVGAATVVAQLAGAFGGLLWYYFFPADFSMPLKLWGLLLLACVFYTLNDRLGAEVKKHLDISEAIIISKMSDVFLIIIGILVFAQFPSVWKLLGAGMIIIGQIALYMKKWKLDFSKKYALLALLVSLIFAIALSIDIGVSSSINLPFYTFLTLFIPSLMLYFGEKIKVTEIVTEYKHANKFELAITGLSWGSYIVVLLMAYSFGSIITVIIFNAIALIINVLLGILVQKEHDGILGKLVALCLVVIGIAVSTL